MPPGPAKAHAGDEGPALTPPHPMSKRSQKQGVSVTFSSCRNWAGQSTLVGGPASALTPAPIMALPPRVLGLSLSSLLGARPRREARLALVPGQAQGFPESSEPRGAPCMGALEERLLAASGMRPGRAGGRHSLTHSGRLPAKPFGALKRNCVWVHGANQAPSELNPTRSLKASRVRHGSEACLQSRDRARPGSSSHPHPLTSPLLHEEVLGSRAEHLLYTPRNAHRGAHCGPSTGHH